MKKNISILLILLAGIEMLFAKDSGNWKKYESMKKDDYSVNENFWKKYKGISKVLSEEIPADKLYEVTDNYVFWIVGNSYGEEMHEKLMKLPEIVRYSYLVYSYEAEINNGGFDQFFFNSIGYEVFEIQKALDFFGLTKNKEILDIADVLTKTIKFDILNMALSAENIDVNRPKFNSELNGSGLSAINQLGLGEHGPAKTANHHTKTKKENTSASKSKESEFKFDIKNINVNDADIALTHFFEGEKIAHKFDNLFVKIANLSSDFGKPFDVKVDMKS
ncbi:DMP19 family protein, partial [Treponema socranskii]|uniref:DMP19 family protein n=1 Tax=Treponema socranskii TaxID=53419 RepID=UPI0023F2B323